ncbi:hypothetical protein Forpi1262_v017986 [Fusarium oxysporum f. sp. raphani]|uniref:Transposase Tc1-like domain-containing protein n=1 Tax=Fusarium oxysporum f. sp. raphani TaxID=96318 RepID=A0A8J5NVB8_FUSOX|nr:hypothetical protein Forpi1262_v017986 [Fusarium oxysporum f. sp. raphani]
MVAEVYAGKSMRQVAASYSTDPGTVSRTVKRWKENHNNVSGARSGRPQKLSARKIISIQSFIKRNRSITWNEALLELGVEVSARTLRRRLESSASPTRSRFQTPRTTLTAGSFADLMRSIVWT